jgi:hypothetical protein
VRVIPEYEPVGRLCLSFVEEFFNSRFRYGLAIAAMAKAALDLVEVEIFVCPEDRPALEGELRAAGVDPACVTLNTDSPGRGILAEYMPVFCRDGRGLPRGLVFPVDSLDLRDEVLHFSGRFLDSLGVEPLRMDISFATAKLAVNGDLCLVSGEEGSENVLEFLRQALEGMEVRSVPPLAGDITGDLDMFLWPVVPGTWLVSEYPRGTEQSESVEESVRVIRQHGHRVLRLPGLERIRRDDVNTMPNYANGVLINGRALHPAYGRPEDVRVGEILSSLGLDPVPIDSGNIILTQSGPHCISKTVPSSVLPS